MNDYLLDTNVLILALRRNLRVLDWLEATQHTRYLYVSVISRTEVLAGMQPREEQMTRALLGSLINLPVYTSIGDRAGLLIYEQARRGHQVSFPDALIAATALEHDLTLVTTNVRHFPMLDKQVTPLADHLPTTE